MITRNGLDVPDGEAAADGKSVEESAAEPLRIEDWSLENLMAYGAERANALGFREEQAADIVDEWRKGRE